MAKQTFTTGQVLTAAQMTSLQQTAMGGGSTTAKTASYVLVAADAGTVVQMNSASATTITVNTALFAAGDTVQIQNVGAGVCTVTAGTATVSTSAVLALKQYDAGSLYFNTANAALFFAADAADTTSPLTTKGDIYTFSTTNDRLPVGTNNQTLVADSSTSTGLKWATPASGSTFVGVAATANSSTLSVTGNVQYSLPFNSEDFDTDAFHSTSSNNTRITIPTGKGGKYLINAGLDCDIATNYAYLIFVKNGSNTGGSTGPNGAFISAILNVGSNTSKLQGSCVLSLAQGDYIEVGFQNSGSGTMTYNARFSAVYLGA